MASIVVVAGVHESAERVIWKKPIWSDEGSSDGACSACSEILCKLPSLASACFAPALVCISVQCAYAHVHARLL
jgi:hypothetical protein